MERFGVKRAFVPLAVFALIVNKTTIFVRKIQAWGIGREFNSKNLEMWYIGTMAADEEYEREALEQA